MGVGWDQRIGRGIGASAVILALVTPGLARPAVADDGHGSGPGIESTALSADASDIDDATAAGSVGGADFEIEEVVVTARRRAEKLITIPSAISAFSENQIKDLQATDMRGLQYSVPNFYFERGDSSNAVAYIRGIGQNDSLPFVEPGVAVYVDDVYMARTQAAFIELFDVERVEVLRGPQGVLYGRNSPGGAVKLITKRPSDTPEAYLELGAGRFALATINGRVSGPLNGDSSLKGKIAFTLARRDGFSRNAALGGRDGDTRMGAGRATLLYEPRGDLEISFSFDGKVERPKRSLSPIRTTPLLAFANPLTDPGNPTLFQPNQQVFGSQYVVEATANDFARLTTYGLTFKVHKDLSAAWSFDSITSFRHMDWDFLIDADGSPLAALDIPVFQTQKQVTTEARLSYDNGAGLTFTGGVYLFHDFDNTLAGFDDPAAAFFGFPIISFGVASSGNGQSRQRTDSVAVFGDFTIPFGESTNLEVGLRYTYDEKRMRRQNEFFFDPSVLVTRDFPPFLAGIGFPGEELLGKKDFDAFTPRIALSRDIGGDGIVFASVSRGFKSGGFPGRAFNAAGFQPFAPEIVWTYEGGVKSRVLNGRATFGLTYFYNRYRDLQVNGFGQDPDTGLFVSLFTNAARARIQGVEATFSTQPTEGLTLSGSTGFLDASYQDFKTLVNGILTDVSNRRLPDAPKWTASLNATYKHDLTRRWVGTYHVDAAYRGTHATETTDSPNLLATEVVLVNAFVSVGTPDARWELRVGVTNLTDRGRTVHGFNISEFSGVETAFIGPPRLFDVRLFFRK